MSLQGTPSVRISGGVLDISSLSIKNMRFIQSQNTLTTLLVNNNSITSFITLESQPNLTIINASNNPIKYVDGLENHPKLLEIDLSGTPVSQESMFRVRLLATIGRRLEKINGESVTESEIHQAELMRERAPRAMLNRENYSSNKPKELEDAEWRQFLAYTKCHSDALRNMALNEAKLWDLKNSGPLPSVNDSSPEYEIVTAIKNLKERNTRLENAIKELY